MSRSSPLERKRSVNLRDDAAHQSLSRPRSFTGIYVENLCALQTLKKVLQALVAIAIILMLGITLHEMFPDLAATFKAYASWANSTGAYGKAVFVFGAGLLLLIPGVPGSLLCFTCGAVFPLKTALVVAAVGHHIGACLAFLLSRNVMRSSFDRLIATRPTLRAMSRAAKLEQWKVTFLSRFIVMPVQLKNYVFGVLPVSFKCFFSMALLGDLQSTIFSTYLGYLSNSIIGGMQAGLASSGGSSQPAPEDPSSRLYSRVIGACTLAIAVTMTTVASLVARRAYKDVLREIELAEDRDVLERSTLLRDDMDLRRDDRTVSSAVEMEEATGEISPGGKVHLHRHASPRNVVGSSSSLPV